MAKFFKKPNKNKTEATKVEKKIKKGKKENKPIKKESIEKKEEKEPISKKVSSKKMVYFGRNQAPIKMQMEKVCYHV